MQAVSGPALVLPLSHATQAPPEQTPFAPPFEQAAPFGHDETAPSVASRLMLLSAALPPSFDAESLPPLSFGAESTAPLLSGVSESPPALPSSAATSLVASDTFPPSFPPSPPREVDDPLPPQPVRSSAPAAPATVANTSK